MTARAVLDASMTERQWQRLVVDMARMHGWACFHPYDSRHSVAGYPDLTLIKGRIVFAELKRERGRVSAAQEVWLAAIKAAGGECYVWKPSQWDEVQRVLGGAQ